MRAERVVLAAVVAAGLVACGSETPRASEEAAAPLAIDAVRQVVLDNEFATAFTLTLEPGQSVAPHEGAARVVYSLSDYTIRYSEGADSRETSWRTGDAHVHAPGTHAIANTGTTTARLLVVYRADTELPAGGSAAVEAAGGEPTNLLVDDERFRVSVVAIPVGGVLPQHAGLPRVVYSLSEYSIRYEAEGAAATEQSFRTGEAHWHPADRHAITNTGTTDARFLVVQFKQ
jgi:hypothetical protein